MNQRRFYALDLLRTFAVLVITFYHVWESSIGESHMFFTRSQSVYAYLTQFFVDYWSYSGLILALISFFLIGFSKKDINLFRFLLVAVGLFGMMVHDQAGLDAQSWSWNLYGYLLVCLITVQILPKNKTLLAFVSLIALIGLVIPIETFQTLKFGGLPILDQMLTGDLSESTTIGWGLLPWLSIPVLGFSIGRILRDLPADSKVFRGFKYEVPVLLSMALVLIALFPMRRNVSVSPTGFYYYVFSGSLWFFWSRFAVIFIWMRLACLDSVNKFLGKFNFMQMISKLAWNRYFGICYFVQLIFLSWAADLATDFRQSPYLMDLYWVGLLVATEILTRLLVKRLSTFKLSAYKLVNRT
ncbi:hypothetical protein ACLVWU_00420 [Bdellovibrio sp. HCB290]|uniref:hypothetical protein n=1 Tax=Bdellovibrio sp. HCB290 TaxID=3394356 RepID=UPI0039B4A089